MNRVTEAGIWNRTGVKELEAIRTGTCQESAARPGMVPVATVSFQMGAFVLFTGDTLRIWSPAPYPYTTVD